MSQGRKGLSKGKRRDHTFFYPFSYPFFHLSLLPPIHQTFIHPPIHPFIPLSIHPSTHTSIHHPLIHSFIHPPIHSSIYPSSTHPLTIHPSCSPSVPLHPSLHFSIPLSLPLCHSHTMLHVVPNITVREDAWLLVPSMSCFSPVPVGGAATGTP